jgi:hypothetical protein
MLPLFFRRAWKVDIVMIALFTAIAHAQRRWFTVHH